MHVANSMDTHADIVTDHMRASNVVSNTIVRTARKPDTPAKCALCGGNHPSNYKGCECYHNIRDINPHRNSPAIETTQPTMKSHHNPLSIAPYFNRNIYAPTQTWSIITHKSQMTQPSHLPPSLVNLKIFSHNSYIKTALY